MEHLGAGGSYGKCQRYTDCEQRWFRHYHGALHREFLRLLYGCDRECNRPGNRAVKDSTGNHQSGSTGSTLPDTLRVVVRDNVGNAVSGIPVAWKVLLGGGTVTPIAAGGRGGSAAGVTNAAGVAAATLTLGPPGPQRVEARRAASPAVFFRATSN